MTTILHLRRLKRRAVRRLAALALLAFGALMPALGQDLRGSYALTADSDGTKPAAGARLVLTFAAAGTVKLFATRPGETVNDTGTYSIAGGRITIQFQEVDWAASNQPFTFDGCTLTLPFKAVSATEGAGTSAWQKQDPKCTGGATAAAAATASPSGPKPLTAFSADETITSGGQKRKIKIYATDKALRSESAPGDPPSVTIVRSDRSVMWVLNPQTRTYTESQFTLGGGTALFQSGSMAPGCTAAGDEQIGAYHCQKQVCQTAAGGKTGTETQWSAKELGGLVIRYSDGTDTLEMENVKPGPQDPALFQVPPGYTKKP